MGSVIIGGLSFRSGRMAQSPPVQNLRGLSPKIANGEDEVRRWQAAANATPNDPWVFRNLARALAAQGKFPDAEKAAQKALALSPQNDLNFELLGEIKAREGKVSEAVSFFKKAVKTRPKDPALLFELAETLTKSGKDDEAAAYYKAIVAANPQSIEGVRSRLALLDLDFYQKKYEEAKVQALALLALAPKEPRLLIKLGEIFEAEKKLPEAISYYEKAKQISPNDPELLRHLAELHSKTK